MWFITQAMAFSLPGIARAEEDHDIRLRQPHVPVVVDGDAGQGPWRLALGAGAGRRYDVAG